MTALVAKRGSNSRSQSCTFLKAGSNGRECRANYPNHNCLCNFDDLLAEGEELGSNLLHVGQSTPASSCVRSSWQRRGQGHHEPEAPPPPGEQPAPSVLGKKSVA